MTLCILLGAGGTMEVAKTSLPEARSYFTTEMKKIGKDISDIENFDENFNLLKKKVAKGTEPRIDMPVVSWKQVKAFQQKLVNGELDVKKPFNKDVKDSIGKFPTKIKKKDRDIWLDSGEHDGETEDDKVNAKFETVKAKDLTPVQAQIYLSKAIVNFEKFGVTEDGNFLTQKTLIVDSNNWATAMIADSNIKMKVLKVDLKLSKLLKVSKSFGVVMGNKQNK